MGARAARPHGGAPVTAVVVGGWCSVGEGKTKSEKEGEKRSWGNERATKKNN